jgi:hypothetical protein
MSDIKIIKENEMSDIKDFCQGVDEYGHIFHLDPKLLDEPFKKIMDGITVIQKMMDDSFNM